MKKIKEEREVAFKLMFEKTKKINKHPLFE